MLFVIAMMASVLPTGLHAAPEPAEVFIHTASGGDYISTIDHPSCNGQPDRRLIVTQRYQGTLNDRPIGVYYQVSIQRWTIYNEDQVSIPAGAAFNVRVVGANSTRTTLFNASAKNSSDAYSVMPMRAGNPNAILLATHVWNRNPLVEMGVRFNSSFSVKYGLLPGAPDKWTIGNNSGAQALAAAFHVLDATEDGKAFTVNAPGATYYFALDNPRLNANPDAMVFVTQNTSSSGVNINPSVQYFNGGWVLFNQSFGTIPAGTRFNVKFYTAPTP